MRLPLTLLTVVLLAVATVANAQYYIVYLPTSGVSNPLPASLSGYVVVFNGTGDTLIYPVNPPTTLSPSVSTYTAIIGLTASSSGFDGASAWNYTSPIVTSVGFYGGTVASTYISGALRTSNFVALSVITATAEASTSVTLTVTAASTGININCIMTLVNSTYVTSVSGSWSSVSSGTSESLSITLGVTVNTKYVLGAVCWATGYVNWGLTYGSGLSATPPTLPFYPGNKTEVYYSSAQFSNWQVYVRGIYSSPLYGFNATAATNSLTQGDYFQLPQCQVTSNPYSGGGYTGKTGTFGLLNCVAIKYTGITVAVWFYLPPSGQGVIFFYGGPGGSVPWLYVGTNSYLYFGDFAAGVGFWQLSTPISPGWHLAIASEWAASTSGPYYIQLWLDGKYIGKSSATSLTQLYGFYTYFPSNFIGMGYTGGGWPNTDNSYFFFSGTIATVAVYYGVLSNATIQQMSQGTVFGSNYVAPYVYTGSNLVAVYVTAQGFYNPSTYLLQPWLVNASAMQAMGISNYGATSLLPDGATGALPSGVWDVKHIVVIGPQFYIAGASYMLTNASQVWLGGYSSTVTIGVTPSQQVLSYWTVNSTTYTVPVTPHTTTLWVPFALPPYMYVGVFYINQTAPSSYPMVQFQPLTYGGSAVQAMGNLVIEPSGYAPWSINTLSTFGPSTFYLAIGGLSTVTVSLPNEYFTNANTGGVGHVQFTVPSTSGVFATVAGPVYSVSGVGAAYIGYWQYSSSLVNNLGRVYVMQPNNASNPVSAVQLSSGSFPLNASTYLILINTTTVISGLTFVNTPNYAWYPQLSYYTLQPGGKYFIVAGSAQGGTGYVGPPVFATTIPGMPVLKPYSGSSFTTASGALIKVFNLTSGNLLTQANFSSFSNLYLYPNIWGVYVNATLIFPNMANEYGVVGFYTSTVPKSTIALYVSVTQTAASTWSGTVQSGLISDYSGQWLWLNGTMYAGLVAGQYSVDEFEVPSNLINTPTGFAFYDLNTNTYSSLITSLNPSTYIVLGTFGNTLIKTLFTIGYTAAQAVPPPLILPTLSQSLLSLGSSSFSQLVLTGSVIAVFIILASRLRSIEVAGIVTGAMSAVLGALLSVFSMIGVGVVILSVSIAYKYLKSQ